MVAILSNQREVIIGAVRAMYTQVAMVPEKGFHFPTGRPACELLGYPKAQLDAIPATAVESFAGVGYPFAAEVIRPGNVVLDIGSGSGTDALIASLLVGPSGQVYGLDMTEAMQAKLRSIAAKMGAANVEVLEGEAENIPLADESVDVVTTNGVLNLVPDKARAAREIGRVLRPGGLLQLADIVVTTLPSEACRSHPEIWAECIVGATTINEYSAMFAAAGLRDLEVLGTLDYFAGSASAETRKVAASFGAHTVMLRAVRS
jgi:arsenite methyltransferase